MNKSLIFLFMVTILIYSNAINLDKHDGQDLQYSNCEMACTKATQQPVICGGTCCDFTKCKRNRCSQPIKIIGCF